MKKTALTLILCLGTAAPLLADGTNMFTMLATGTNSLSDERQRVSYAVGMILGHSWQQRGVDVDFDMVVRGIKDEESGGPTLLTEQEMRETLQQYQKVLDAKQQEMREQLAAKNKAEADMFLAKNKSKPGIVTLPDGLQYKVVTEGSGPVPSLTNVVSVDYRGTLIDGTVFDGTARRGAPAQLDVSHVIPGWKEALTKMKTGSEWELYVPPDLAYGARGQRDIPPNSLLIFDVKLISISAPRPMVASGPGTPLTSDIIKVPSAEEMKKGAKIEVIKPEDIPQAQAQSKTN